MKGVYKPGVVVLVLLAITTTASAFTEIGDNITVVNNVTAQNFLGYLNWAYLLGIPIDFPNSTVASYSGNFPNTSLPNYLLISTYNGDFPNSTLPNYLLISTYGGNFPNNTLAGYGNNFPNSTLAGYGGNFPNTSLPNYLLISTYGGNFPNNTLAGYNNNFPNSTLAGYDGNFPNTSLPNYLLISTYNGDFPNSTLAGYNNNFPNSTLAGYGGNFPNTSLSNYLLISTYSGNFPNSTLAGYNNNFPNSTLASYGGNFPNTSLSNYLLISTYSGNFPNSTLASYGGNFPNTSLLNYLLISTYNGDFPNSTLPNYLLISTYSGNFPNNTLAGYGGNFPNTSLPNYLLISTYAGNFPNGTVASKEAAWDAKTNFSLNVSGQPQIYNSASLTAGTNISLSQSGNTITISSTGVGVAAHDLNGTTHTGYLDYVRIINVLVNLANNVTGLLQDANIASAGTWNAKTTLAQVNQSANLYNVNGANITGIIPTVSYLGAVNTTANLYNVNGTNITTGTIPTARYLDAVNTTAQISRLQVTGQTGVDNSQNTSITNLQSMAMDIPFWVDTAAATSNTNLLAALTELDTTNFVARRSISNTDIGNNVSCVVNVRRTSTQGGATVTINVSIRDTANTANVLCDVSSTTSNAAVATYTNNSAYVAKPAWFNAETVLGVYTQNGDGTADFGFRYIALRHKS
jgi:hypothetical protein